LAISGFGQVPVLGPIIKAIDLKVQQLQNETLVLQNLQKQIENKLHAMKLAEISEWSQKQKFLFKEYYAELGQVRPALDSLFTRKKY
jgi:hypothetical protein